MGVAAARWANHRAKRRLHARSNDNSEKRFKRLLIFYDTPLLISLDRAENDNGGRRRRADALITRWQDPRRCGAIYAYTGRPVDWYAGLGGQLIHQLNNFLLALAERRPFARDRARSAYFAHTSCAGAQWECIFRRVTNDSSDAAGARARDPCRHATRRRFAVSRGCAARMAATGTRRAPCASSPDPRASSRASCAPSRRMLALGARRGWPPVRPRRLLAARRPTSRSIGESLGACAPARTLAVHVTRQGDKLEGGRRVGHRLLVGGAHRRLPAHVREPARSCECLRSAWNGQRHARGAATARPAARTQSQSAHGRATDRGRGRTSSPQSDRSS